MSITKQYLNDKLITDSIKSQFETSKIYSIQDICEKINDGIDDIFGRKISKNKSLEIFKIIFSDRIIIGNIQANLTDMSYSPSRTTYEISPEEISI